MRAHRFSSHWTPGTLRLKAWRCSLTRARKSSSVAAAAAAWFLTELGCSGAHGSGVIVVRKEGSMAFQAVGSESASEVWLRRVLGCMFA